MCKKIAVTGGIGSGKSTFMRMLSGYGATCLSADGIYAEMLNDSSFVKKISDALGVAPIKNGENLKLDKKAVAAKVFSDKAELEKLNKITHGEIMREMFKRAENVGGAVFCEVPLLYEGGFDKLFDCVVVVTREENARIQAVALRDGRDEKQTSDIIKNQFDYSKIKKDGHTIFIDNNGDERSLNEKAEKLVDMFKN